MSEENYCLENDVQAKEKLLEVLRSKLDAGRGFVLSAVIEIDGKPTVVGALGGTLSNIAPSILMASSFDLSQKIIKMGKDLAERDEHFPPQRSLTTESRNQ